MAGTFAFSILRMTSKLVATIQRLLSASSSSSSSSNSVLEEIKKLQRRLFIIQDMINDAEEREIRDHFEESEISNEYLNPWMEELKDIAYDADNILDEYAYELLRSKVEDIALSTKKTGKRKRDDEVSDLLTFPQTKLSYWDDITHKIRIVRERFDEIAKHGALVLRKENGERRPENMKNRRKTTYQIDESSIYGREDEKNKVIKLLLSESDSVGDTFSVIPILGMGGIGKTTVAQLVYNDPRICQYFNRKGWIYVSNQNFDVIRLTKEIIESITTQPCHLTELCQLQDTLKEEMKGKKVLLVLDDLWNEKVNHWESLRGPFIGAGRVKIIITTRNELVAKFTETVPHIHLDCLSEDQCWLLFERYVFDGQDPNVYANLMGIGRKIVKRCGGLPLAVKVLGDLLRCEIHEERWMDILKSDLWELEKSRVEIMSTLTLSYLCMPAYLKLCFMYCSLYPQDYQFNKEHIVKQWMTHGFIRPRGTKRAEDMGNDYFNALVGRSFFQPSSNEYGEEKFVMHILIHDLAKFISR